jgi:pimeloyl-ACP methyl ester carboxylesterase
MSLNDVSVVLVHGAWADGSSWSKVIGPLRAEGARVVAAPLPLTSLTDDVAALDRTLERIEGQVVLVGHAYAGAVIAATRDEKVRSLVYIAALAPDEGETVADVFYRAEPHPRAPKLAPDNHGAIWLPDNAFAEAFARHASRGAGAAGCRSAADRPSLHQRQGGPAALEGSCELVPRGRAGPHDRPRHPAFHGAADEGASALTPGRSYADRDGARHGRGHHPRCHARCNGDPYARPMR